MGVVKQLRVVPIGKADADAIVKKNHYSGSVVRSSKVHFGVFLHGVCLGAMQFGSPMDKRRMISLVEGTRWNGMLELNRMAFSDSLPKNSESRCLSVALRTLRKLYPCIEWVVSFADGCQCGDGAIYRAAGFDLLQIKRNNGIVRLPDGRITTRKTLDNSPVYNMKYWREHGAVPLDGFQMKYVYFLRREARSRLTCPVLPYSAIAAAGAKMYKGRRAASIDADAPADQAGEGGSNPTAALQS